mmetsp:Transcript_88422/g.250623  ORF Transcript_88422/g.250623 Transcript_88422/m.250623 type:complete len:327 (-) Transcript_88422:610-1590(-)
MAREVKEPRELHLLLRPGQRRRARAHRRLGERQGRGQERAERRGGQQGLLPGARGRARLRGLPAGRPRNADVPDHGGRRARLAALGRRRGAARAGRGARRAVPRAAAAAPGARPGAGLLPGAAAPVPLRRQGRGPGRDPHGHEAQRLAQVEQDPGHRGAAPHDLELLGDPGGRHLRGAPLRWRGLHAAPDPALQQRHRADLASQGRADDDEHPCHGRPLLQQRAVPRLRAQPHDAQVLHVPLHRRSPAREAPRWPLHLPAGRAADAGLGLAAAVLHLRGRAAAAAAGRGPGPGPRRQLCVAAHERAPVHQHDQRAGRARDHPDRRH